MDWHFVSDKAVQHKSGFRVELLSGSWDVPEGVNPIIPTEMRYSKISCLIRQGIEFAMCNSFDSYGLSKSRPNH